MRLFGPEPKKPKERKSPVVSLRRTIAAMALAGIVIICGILALAMPRMEEIIVSCARSKASGEIDKALLYYFEKNSVTYSKLVNINYDKNGAISSVTADTAAIDALMARLDDGIGGELEEKLMEAEIPLNVVLGTELFMGGGRNIKIHFFPISVVNVGARHEFTAKGLNQTLHTVYLDISVDIEVMLPLKNKRTNVSTEAMIGQTLIVGGVPNTYVTR